MAVYEDDPRRKPKLQSYGGGSNRGSAKRGEPKESTGSTPGEKKNPRLQPSPRKPGADRLPPAGGSSEAPRETPLHRDIHSAVPFIESGIRDLMRVASPFTRWMVGNDEKRSGSHPSLKNLLDAEENNTTMRDFKTRGPGGGSQDQGIRANPPGYIPKKPPSTTGKFGPGHLPPYQRPALTPEQEKKLAEEFQKFMEGLDAERNRGIEA